MPLVVVHRPRAADAPPLPGRVWSTCLRDVAFLSGDEPGSVAGTLTDEAAYAAVLEIVCGLRSPLVGETEVQAQFKAFLASLDPLTHGPLRQIGQQILGDAKAVRHEYLQGLGVGGYGRLSVRCATGVHMAIVGAGALARDIAAHCDPAHPIDLWQRRAADASAALDRPCRHLRLDEAAAVPPVAARTTVFVAAPVDAAALAPVLTRYAALAEVIDLRAIDDVTALRDVRHVTLADILESATFDDDLRPVAAARVAVAACARRFARASQLRPFGWDDLCA